MCVCRVYVVRCKSLVDVWLVSVISVRASALQVCCYRYSFEVIEESARYLLAKTRHRPKIGVICGSGLGKHLPLPLPSHIFHSRLTCNFTVMLLMLLCC